MIELSKVDLENKRLTKQVSAMERELMIIKQELHEQLNLREKELKELFNEKKKYEQLQHKYQSLRSSFLGRCTIKYWRIRKKLRVTLGNK
ncbi:hypothetical protein QUF88_27300 [Bacillus sp. DX1.1]|uniref:hypothetical protein n=1 Tax=unclassified Bacillus (in: firmicutes) TaxID=185979 RepID=UPI002571231E|nr:MULTISPECIES: hypothetical protein [unclassified Bacillus (in: firmicutes)]MDM5157390.1 hypothetical protein [Bacillus sp. DX1.1]WJE81615.1 hypothetical protein QRE67_24840 [Bacillus sp. DX3.1]